MQLKACLKKDFIELLKTKKWYALLAASIGSAFLSLLVIVFFKVLQNSGVDVSSFIGIEDPSVASLFSITYSSSFMYFAIYICTYFAIIMIVLYGGIFSKEIKDKKWVMPLSCGIRAENLVLSKIIVNLIGLVVLLLAGCLINFVTTILLCESGGLAIGSLLLLYLMMIVFMVFMYLLTICLNAITKSTKISVIVSIVCLILLPEVLSMFKVANITFINFTPFLFNQIVLMGGAVPLNAYSALEYIIASAVTCGVSVLLVILSISFNKIKKIEK